MIACFDFQGTHQQQLVSIILLLQSKLAWAAAAITTRIISLSGVADHPSHRRTTVGAGADFLFSTRRQILVVALAS